MTLSVRPATADDLPALVAYEIEIAEASFGAEAVTDPAKHEGRIVKGLERDPDGCLVVVDAAGKVRGWLWMAINTNFVTGDRYANFRSLAVSSGADSTAVARLLIDAGLAYARAHDVTHVTGKVNAANVPMRVLYAEFGFAPTHLTMEARLDGLTRNDSGATDSVVRQPVVKCIVWDLDGTVWDDVAVELPEGVLPRPRADVLATMRRLSDHGIVNALASRTAPEVGHLVAAWPQLDGLLVAKQIAWQDKSRAIELIAEELGVAIDSLLLVDDTAFERAEVGHTLPGVRTMDREELLARLPEILPAHPSSEAGRRTTRYQANARRRDAARAYADRVAFLRSCAMRLSVRPAKPNELPRVLELATRANRLSSTGLALDDGLLSRYAADGRVFVGGLTDRFGDDGLVAIALLAPTGRPVDEVPAARPSTADPGGLRVELLSVSCRVAGRGVAEAFVAELTALADAADGRGLTIPIRATGANTELRVLLRSMGFDLVEVGPDLLEARSEGGRLEAPGWIAVDSPGAKETPAPMSDEPFADADADEPADAAGDAASVLVIEQGDPAPLPGPPSPETHPPSTVGDPRSAGVGNGIRQEGRLDALVGDALGMNADDVARLPDDTSLLRPPLALSSLAGARLLARIDETFGGSLAAADLTLEALTSLGALRAYVARRTR